MSQRIHKQAVLLMMLFDIITIITSYVIANYIRFKDIHHNVTPQGYLDIMWVFVIVYLLISLFSTNTSGRLYHTIWRDIYEVCLTHIYMGAAIFAYLYAIQKGSLYSRYQITVFFLVDILLMLIVHQIVKDIFMKLFRHTTYCERVMLITSLELLTNVVQKIKKTKNWYFRIKGIAVIDCDMSGEYISDIPVVADGSNYLKHIRESAYDAVIINMPNNGSLKYDILVEQLIDMGIVVHINIPDFVLPIRSEERRFGKEC